MILKRTFLFSSLLTVSLFTGNAFSKKLPDDFLLPLKITPYLSGNYGELRGNHLHTGLDFKTQGAVGQDVLCVEEGWVSRISISPWGYGYALYVDHPGGLTSVYGHLQKFSPRIQEVARKYQYEMESFGINYICKPGELTVKRGEVIAKSGNSGSSGGPHLHFELRNTKTEETVDPTPYFRHLIKDTTTPEVRLLRLYSRGGLINGAVTPVNALPSGGGINKTLTGWGKIGIGVKAYDRMDGTSNIYGVKKILLYVDDKLQLDYEVNHFLIPEARYVNSFIDYDDWRLHKSQVMRLFTDPGNFLNCFQKVKDHGEIHITKERDYHIRMILADAFDNSRTLEFVIRGKKGQLPPEPQKSKTTFRYDHVNKLDTDLIRFIIPKGAIYHDFDFNYTLEKSVRGYSDIFRLHNKSIPLHQYCELRIKVAHDTLRDKSKYYLAERIGNRSNFIASKYEKGYVTGSVRAFGNYWVTADTIAPILTAVQPERWGKTGIIRYRMSDAHSGIKSWKGYVDGKFALFEYDGRSGIIEYRIDTARIGRKKKHQLQVVLTDNCNNEKQVEKSFYW